MRLTGPFLPAPGRHRPSGSFRSGTMPGSLRTCGVLRCRWGGTSATGRPVIARLDLSGDVGQRGSGRTAECVWPAHRPGPPPGRAPPAAPDAGRTGDRVRALARLPRETGGTAKCAAASGTAQAREAAGTLAAFLRRRRRSRLCPAPAPRPLCRRSSRDACRDRLHWPPGPPRSPCPSPRRSPRARLATRRPRPRSARRQPRAAVHRGRQWHREVVGPDAQERPSPAPGPQPEPCGPGAVARLLAVRGPRPRTAACVSPVAVVFTRSVGEKALLNRTSHLNRLCRHHWKRTWHSEVRPEEKGGGTMATATSRAVPRPSACWP